MKLEDFIIEGRQINETMKKGWLCTDGCGFNSAYQRSKNTIEEKEHDNWN